MAKPKKQNLTPPVAPISDTTVEFGFRPLYRQVRDTLIRRLIDGVWLPGQPLPSEIQLAAELGVSQGTVRKALDAMTAENLVVRKQGRGTFVAEYNEERVLFQFFKLVPDHGQPSFPISQLLSCTTAKANAEERERLMLAANGRVVRIRRVRAIEDKPVVSELVVLPEHLFPNIAGMDLPNNLYGLYGMRFGISVALTRERLKAIAASPEDAQTLGIAAGTPLLSVDRLALSLDQVPIEWRVSNCLTEHVYYQSDLR
jgi:GntR family transcriptional regulator